jgi:hypothetical protein
MRQSTACSQFAKIFLVGLIVVLLGSAVVTAQRGNTAKSESDTLKGEILQGVMPGRVSPHISSICTLSGSVVNGIAAGPYSGAFTENILTFINEPRKLAFNARFEIVNPSQKERVNGRIEGYDPGSDWNHCSVSAEVSGRGDFSSQFVAQYTAEAVTPKGSCRISGKAKIIFAAAIREKVIIPGGSFQAEILDSTPCEYH